MDTNNKSCHTPIIFDVDGEQIPRPKPGQKTKEVKKSLKHKINAMDSLEQLIRSEKDYRKKKLLDKAMEEVMKI